MGESQLSAEDQIVLHLYDQGLRTDDIAARLRIPQVSVLHILNRALNARNGFKGIARYDHGK